MNQAVENPVDDTIMTSTYISNAIRIQAIAELIENDATLERTTTLGVDYASGDGITER